MNYRIKRKIKNFIARHFTFSERENSVNKYFAFTNTSNIKGDYLEFGVFKGKTFISAYHAARGYGLEMNFYAFDSFEGLPETKGADQDFDAFQKGQFSCDLDSFKSILKKNDVNLKKCEFIPGFFDTTLTKQTQDKLTIKMAAVIHIDCDLYESTVPVLKFIEKYLQTGTVLSFDDWFCYAASPEHGEQKAVREWLESNPHIHLTEFSNTGAHGKAFIVYLKTK